MGLIFILCGFFFCGHVSVFHVIRQYRSLYIYYYMSRERRCPAANCRRVERFFSIYRPPVVAKADKVCAEYYA